MDLSTLEFRLACLAPLVTAVQGAALPFFFSLLLFLTEFPSPRIPSLALPDFYLIGVSYPCFFRPSTVVVDEKEGFSGISHPVG